MNADSELMILLAGIHKQNSEILDKLNHLEKRLSAVEDTIKGQYQDPDNVWAIGFKGLQSELRCRGLEVSIVRLKKYRDCNILRLSDDEELEVRNIGTAKLSRWRFHVGNCKAAIAHIEDRAVLGDAGDEVAPLLGHALDREVVGLRRAAREDDLARVRADHRRDLFSGGLDGLRRVAAEGVVAARRVAEALLEEGEHRVQHARIQGSRGVVIEVDHVARHRDTETF